MKQQMQEFVAYLFRHWRDQARRHVILWRKVRVLISVFSIFYIEGLYIWSRFDYKR